jgi:DNA-binding NtrC family response regulator
MSFLFVDDDPNIVDFYADIFEIAYPSEKRWYAENGKQALRWSSEPCLKHSLIISDLKMPDMDGLAFIRSLRSGDSINKATPVILVSGNISRLSPSDVKGMNVHLMEKPVNVKRLIELCSKLIGLNPANVQY